MGTFQSFRKAYGALKDSTTVGLAKVNSEFKDLDVAIVKATNHAEAPPKERHVRKIFAATTVLRPRADVAYCIHALARRLSKTRNWIVAIKVLIVIHRTLREGDPTFREEFVNYSHRGCILHMANFKDNSSPHAWDCSAWVRTYALFLEERLACFRALRYDIEAERLTRASPGVPKVHSRTRVLAAEELLEQLPALQRLLYRLTACQPEGAAFTNYLVQYALALVLKESFKIYCALNDGIINLVDMFFEMNKHIAVKALNIYKRAGRQAERLGDFYDFCKCLELARNFQFPTLRQPPPSFLATMDEYVREAPHSHSAKGKVEYLVRGESPEKPEVTSPRESEMGGKQIEQVEEEKALVDIHEAEPLPEVDSELPPLISTDCDLLGFSEINPKAAELEESNALALAIVPPGNDQLSSSCGWDDLVGATGWELALVTTPSNNIAKAPEIKLAGGFDRLILDSLYEDETARRQIQLQHAGYGYHGLGGAPNPFLQENDPFTVSNVFAPPPNVQMTMLAQQKLMFQQHMYEAPQFQQPNNDVMMVPYSNQPTSSFYPQQQYPAAAAYNPFGDPFAGGYPQESTISQHGNQGLI